MLERLDHILARLPLRGPGPIQVQRIEKVLCAVLGEQVARGIRVVGIRRGRVTLETSSAAQAFELNSFHRPALERDIRDIEGLSGLSEVKVKIGGWSGNDGQRGI